MRKEKSVVSLLMVKLLSARKLCDPSYLTNKVRMVGKVARGICNTSHPNLNTNQSHSGQAMLPQKQLGRKFDMLERFINSAEDIERLIRTEREISHMEDFVHRNDGEEHAGVGIPQKYWSMPETTYNMIFSVFIYSFHYVIEFVIRKFII